MPTFTDQFNGSLSPGGELLPNNFLSPSGTLISSISQFAAGAITPTGDLLRASVYFETGTIAPTGLLSQSLTSNHVGQMAPGGALGNSISTTFAGTLGPIATLAAGIGEAPCNLFLPELRQRTADLLEDPEMIYYTPAEIDHGLNVGQRLFCLITLCIERTVSFPLVNGQAFYEVDSQITDFIAPLRVSFSGTRLRPATLHSLDMLAGTWRLTPGAPTHYSQQGFNLLAIYKQPAAGINTLSITYAAEPSVMALPSDFPEIAPEHQIFLPDFAMWYLRLKEGGAELQAAVKYLQRFLQDAQEYQGYTRARSRAQSYDRFPPDLSSFDRSRFEIKLKNQPRMKKPENPNA